MKASSLIASLVATITRHERYFPAFKWSDKLWTHNVFRFLGMIFGEYYGIRPSIYTTDGRTIAYTLEGQIALFEVYIRGLLKEKAPRLYFIPKLQLAGLSTGSILPYRFAIAFDAASGQQSNAVGTVNAALSHTCTGSNLVLVVAEVGDTSDSVTDISYNSVSMTIVDKLRYPADRWIYQAILTAPSTGTNNVVSSGNTFGSKGAVSYTGCGQSSQPDSHDISKPAAASTITWSTTVVATGCWLWGFCYGDLTDSSAGTGTILRGTTIGSGTGQFDSNGSVGTGSQSLQVVQSSSFSPVVTIMSIAPPASGPTNIKSFDSVAIASIKTFFGVATGSTKTVDGIS